MSDGPGTAARLKARWPRLRRPVDVGAAARRSIDHPAVVVVGLFVLSRLMLVGVGLLTNAAIVGTDQSLSSLLCRFDCNWYLRIAENGYSVVGQPHQPGQTTYAFFPLLPLLIQAISLTTGISALHSGLLIANALFMAALAYVYAYARLLGMSERVALTGVALLCFAPMSFVFSSVYTESLFVLLLAAAMFHLRREEYLLSGVAAALLSATRPNGVLFAIFALAWLVRTHGVGLLARPWTRPQAFVPLALAPLGLFGFWAFSLATTGDAFAHASTGGWGWGFGLALPTDNLASFLDGNARSVFWAATSLVLFAFSMLLVRQDRLEEFALTTAMFLLFWSVIVPNSLPRYAIVLFPIWLGLASAVGRRPALAVGLACGLALVNGFLMTAWTLRELIAI